MIVIHDILIRISKEPTITSVLKELSANVNKSAISRFPVRREYVLVDALGTITRPSFCCSNTIKVCEKTNEDLHYLLVLTLPGSISW